MIQPKILVTTAVGKTGAATVIQLLEGYPVRAMVRAQDKRSEKLRSLGAEIFVGNLDDIVDVRRALDGVQRAYFNPPFTPGMLATSVNFAAAAQQRRLEVVVVMSQWLADPTSPSKHTRESWLADQVFAWMPNVATVTINPGWFADNYRVAGLEIIAQLGIMMLPLGDGLNAPPSNTDIARVIVGVLTNPEPHLGKTYRPTGPRLLSPPQIADIFGKVLGRNVRYVDGPVWMASKAARASGEVSDFQNAQLQTYFEDYKRNAFGTGAPTDAVVEVSGQEPEDFETTIRRYYATAPYSTFARRSTGALSRTMLAMTNALLTPGLDLTKFNLSHDFPQIQNSRLAVDAPDWRQAHMNSAMDDMKPKSALPDIAAAHLVGS